MKDSAKQRAEELDEMVTMGMYRDSLALAEQYFNEADGEYETFCAALECILVMTPDLAHWVPLVERAYAALPESTLPKARFMMLGFYVYASDYQKARAFIPKRFNTKSQLMDLYFAWQVARSLRDTKACDRLSRLLPHFIEGADFSYVRALLCTCHAEHHENHGRWEKAIKCYEGVTDDPTIHKDATVGIVKLRVTQALEAVRVGLKRADDFERMIDPPMELMIPENNKRVQEEARQEFLRLEKLLEAILPKEGQMDICNRGA